MVAVLEVFSFRNVSQSRSLNHKGDLYNGNKLENRSTGLLLILLDHVRVAVLLPRAET